LERFGFGLSLGMSGWINLLLTAEKRLIGECERIGLAQVVF